MKFEGNIPSYLRTGAGSFAIEPNKLATAQKTQNLFEKVKFGVQDMEKQPPISLTMQQEDYQDPNLFRQIQLDMETKPNLMAFEKEKPVQQELPMEFPDELDDKLPTDEQDETKAVQSDIFIG